MRAARLVEAMGAALVSVWAARETIRVLEADVPGLRDLAVFSLSLALAGFLVMDAALGGRVVPAWLAAALAGYRERVRGAPFRLGPLRVWSPEYAVLAVVFAAAAAVGTAAGGPPGLLAAVLGAAGAAYSAYLSVEPPVGSPPPGESRPPWWMRASRVPAWARRLVERPSSALATVLLRLGFEGTREEARSLAIASTTLPAWASIAILAVLLARGLWLEAAAAAAATAAAGPLLLAARYWLRARRESRDARVDLPFLALAGSLAARAGYPLEWAAERLQDLLPSARLLASGRPLPRELRVMYRGYLSVLYSGGDAGRYLEAWSSRGVEAYRLWLEGFISSMQGYAEAVLAVASLGLALGVVAALLPGGDPGLIPAVAAVAVAAAAAGSLVAHFKAPPLRDEYSDRWLLHAAAAGSLAAAAAAWLEAPLWAAAAAALLASSIVYGAAWRVERRAVELEESGLEQLLEQLIEARRTGKPLVEALADARVNAVVDARLRPLKAGVLVDWARGWRSWLARVVMRLLQLAEEAGTTLPLHLEIMLETVSLYRRARSEARARLGRTQAVALAAPPVLALIVSFLEGLTTRMASLGGPLLQPVDAFYFDLARASVVALAAALAVFTSKIAEYTVRDTLRVALSVSAAVAAVMAAPRLVEALLA